MAAHRAPPERADALVLFGATGDLARKKLFPALYHLTATGRLRLPVMGVAVSAWEGAELRAYAADSIRGAVDDLDTARVCQATDSRAAPQLQRRLHEGSPAESALASREAVGTDTDVSAAWPDE